MTCESLREAARQAERFAPLVGGGGRFAARDEGDGVGLLYQPFDPDWPCRRHRVEAVLSATLTFTRWLCGTGVRPRPRSEEHPSELQSLMRISYAVFCLKQKQTPHLS